MFEGTTSLIQNIGNNTYVGKLTTLPGCSALGVSHAVRRTQGEGGTGVEANRRRLKQIKNFGLDAAMCTVDCTNGKQVSVLKANGWQKVFEFLNNQTGHKVYVFMKELNGI